MNEAKLKILRETKEVHGQLIDSAVVSLVANDLDLTKFYLRLCSAVVEVAEEQVVA